MCFWGIIRSLLKLAVGGGVGGAVFHAMCDVFFRGPFASDAITLMSGKAESKKKRKEKAKRRKARPLP
jgi:hypothetical protein